MLRLSRLSLARVSINQTLVSARPMSRRAGRTATAALLLASAVAGVGGFAHSAFAEDAAAPAAEVSPETKKLRSTVETFWHYGKLGRYDLAVVEGQKILDAGAKPLEVLEAFEAIASSRVDARGQADRIDFWMQRWLTVDAPATVAPANVDVAAGATTAPAAGSMKDVTTKLIKLQNEGYVARRTDPKFITVNIERLGTNERAYASAVQQLRESGEIAVPVMLDYLRDSGKARYHASIRRALPQLGRPALSPLCAATTMKDAQTLTFVIGSLGELGYEGALPYLARLLMSADSSPTVKAAATTAISKLNSSLAANPNPGDLFYIEAEKHYYGKATANLDDRNEFAYIWAWDDARGLIKTDVAKTIYNDLQAMQCSEYALKIGGSTGDALSLWLAANYRRELDLPEGTTDATRAAGQPAAHYYGVSSGASYLNAALARAMRDGNSALALKVIKSLYEIAGQANVLGVSGDGPLIDALAYADRRVRYEGAFALAAALPQKPFNGQERVVPLLAEALSQTGLPTVLVAIASENDVAGTVEKWKTAGYGAAGGSTADATVAAAEKLSAVDTIIVSEDIGAAEIDKLFMLADENPRLRGAARIITTATAASPYVARAALDPRLTTTQSKEIDALKSVIEEAGKKAGSVPLSEDVATDYATRAGQLLGKLAISRGQVLDLATAKTTLLASVNDSRPEIVKLGGGVLALLADPQAQGAILTTAAEEKTSDDVKISLFKSLSTSAKFFGNLLDVGQIETLQKVVATHPNLDVRSAAAEARGALNLPSDQAKTLIIEQSKVAK